MRPVLTDARNGLIVHRRGPVRVPRVRSSRGAKDNPMDAIALKKIALVLGYLLVAVGGGVIVVEQAGPGGCPPPATQEEGNA